MKNIKLPGPRANNGCLLSVVDGIGGGKQAYYFFSMPWGQMLFKVIFHLEKFNFHSGLSWIHSTCQICKSFDASKDSSTLPSTHQHHRKSMPLNGRPLSESTALNSP